MTRIPVGKDNHLIGPLSVKDANNLFD